MGAWVIAIWKLDGKENSRISHRKSCLFFSLPVENIDRIIYIILNNIYNISLPVENIDHCIRVVLPAPVSHFIHECEEHAVELDVIAGHRLFEALAIRNERLLPF